ncbi:DUF6804 family protein [uncultured Microbacterium sp.]|uniref:DUF6804 family protein n=1 Tax=uncultured Microbacterium sp. TaxID=191216 RepID=UPI0028DAFDAD|nr:DUF6804 family protein [uncultured Microbacterium sp.]
MAQKQRTPSQYQRNALAPSLIAAAILFLAPALITAGWAPLVQFVAAIFALIIAWFAFQARHWWWIPVFVAVAVLWNPVAPFPFTGPVWTAAQPAAAVVFLAAGATIRIVRK